MACYKGSSFIMILLFVTLVSTGGGKRFAEARNLLEVPDLPKPTLPEIPKPTLPVIPKPTLPELPKPIIPEIPKPMLSQTLDHHHSDESLTC
ncbi:putative protein PELPK [Helianthus annuus]|nr:putative protein PELPK [Helianthus annuus]